MPPKRNEMVFTDLWLAKGRALGVPVRGTAGEYLFESHRFTPAGQRRLSLLM
jgi:hypothetical protein